jgi:thiol:disulfide interchange protein
MGAAIGVAFTLPLFQTFLIFTFLAMGLAVPYLLLSYFPQWLTLLPKPGNWMIRMKEFFAFPMFLTMLWLLWVLEQQTGPTTLFLTLFSFIAVLFLFWFTKNHKKQKVVLAVLGTIAVLIPFFFITTSPTVSRPSVDRWEDYSEAKLQNYLKEGKAVFIDFTASWCITCQVNKRLVLNTDDIQKLFLDNNVVLVKADWTNSDPAITKKLEEFNRNSVPLYVYYDVQSLALNKKPIVLPEILSKQMIYNLMVPTKE